jgi:hypothetical protein
MVACTAQRITGSGSCVLYGQYIGCGTVFKVTANGTETVMHSFEDGSDGAYPWAGLTLDTKGNLYGTTTAGGFGFGVAFTLGRSGTETIPGLTKKSGQVMKLKFGFVKLRYRGLKKNAHQLFVICGLVNLFLSRQKLLTASG